MATLVRLCVLHPEPRPECPAYILVIYETDDPDVVNYKLHVRGLQEPVFEGEYDVDEEWDAGSNLFVLELFDYLTEDEEDCDDFSEDQVVFMEEHAEAVWTEAVRQYGRELS